MFKGQPKGLYALALANTGERFGYYTMLAIFVLFLQAKFGYSETTAFNIYGSFLAMVYFMPLLGGLLADRFGFGKMVTTGIVVMFAGYLMLAVPLATPLTAKVLMFGALFLISCGTGLFKGNLQVMVGNLYDAPQYAAKRDTAFSLFYMAINIGALFAPTAASKITSWFMAKQGLLYEAQIPVLSHQLIDGTITTEGQLKLTELASTMPDVLERFGGKLDQFGQYYIDQLSTSYNYGFGVACISLIVSMIIYVVFRSTFRHADGSAKQQAAAASTPVVELTPKQTKDRIVALLLVFAVVIFFWMSFHQNGGTMTVFARDYTNRIVTGFTRIGFNVLDLALIIISIYALFSFFQTKKGRSKLIAGAVAAAGIAGLVLNYRTMQPELSVQPQIFQQFNPFFVVALTPVSLALFGALARRGKEPSAPRKIGMGMLVAAVGFLVLAIGSMGLASPDTLKDVGGVSDRLVSPNWLISTYLVLTFAELLLSPMGISFVSKVAPPKYKGAMMGCWFAATAIGNYATALIGRLWGGLPLWMVWGVLIVCCLLSALFIFSVMRKLETATRDA